MILKLSFLIVEDDLHCKDFTVFQLEQMKHIQIKKITWCKNFKSSFEEISKGDYDISLIDIKLGQKESGLRLIKMCKANGIIPIILSGMEDKEKEAEKLGAVAFGVKSTEHYVHSTMEKARPYIIQSVSNKIFKHYFATNFDPLKVEVYKFISGAFLNSKDQHLLIEGSGSKALSEGISTLLNNGEIVPSNSILNPKGPRNSEKKEVKIIDFNNFSNEEAKKVIQASKNLVIGHLSKDTKKIAKNFNKIITIPEINMRKSDIPLILNFFAKSYLSFSDEAMNSILIHKWSSVKDLKYLAENLLQEKKNLIINNDDLPAHIKSDLAQAANQKNFPTKFQLDFSKQNGLKKAVSVFRYQVVLKSFNENNFNLSKASRALGVTPAAIKKILDKNSEEL